MTLQQLCEPEGGGHYLDSEYGLYGEFDFRSSSNSGNRFFNP